MPFRLAPGEYCEVHAPGVGIGSPNQGDEEWATVGVGAWIEAKAGDDVRFSPDAVQTTKFEPGPVAGDAKEAVDLWKQIIVERIERELPLPTGAADRELLLRHVMQDLFGTPPSHEEIAAFVADQSPDAQSVLEKRLMARPGIAPYAGQLPAGEIDFKVLPTDPAVAKRPRVASGPGDRNIGDHAHLVIVQRPEGERLVNEASIKFFSADPNAEPPGKPYEVKLPDGRLTWAVAWEPGTTVLWVREKDGYHSYDYTNPAQVKEATQAIDKVPDSMRAALREALPSEEAPATPN